MFNECVADKKYIKIECLRKLKAIDDISELVFGENLTDKLGSRILKKELDKLDKMSEFEKVEHFIQRNLIY